MSIAIITGASRGLGLALTARLAGEGWTVVVDSRDGSALAESMAGLGDVVAIPGDVGDPEHRAAMVAEVERHGSLDLLVNNASLLGPSPQPRLVEYPLDVLRAVYEVNVVAPLALTQQTLHLLTRSGGAVVNVTSDAAVEQYDGWGGYGSSKAALEQLSNVLAVEHPDVAIYWVDPGDMNTQMHQDAFPDEDISDRPDPSESVPGLLWLINERPPSGRYRARDLGERS